MLRQHSPERDQSLSTPPLYCGQYGPYPAVTLVPLIAPTASSAILLPPVSLSGALSTKSLLCAIFGSSDSVYRVLRKSQQANTICTLTFIQFDRNLALTQATDDHDLAAANH